MSSYSSVRELFLIGSLCVALGTQAYGQGTQSTVLGAVTDSSGGRYPEPWLVSRTKARASNEAWRRTRAGIIALQASRLACTRSASQHRASSLTSAPTSTST